jgi:hypothetical protein
VIVGLFVLLLGRAVVKSADTPELGPQTACADFKRFSAGFEAGRESLMEFGSHAKDIMWGAGEGTNAQIAIASANIVTLVGDGSDPGVSGVYAGSLGSDLRQQLSDAESAMARACSNAHY